jgi:hypothetical protein
MSLHILHGLTSNIGVDETWIWRRQYNWYSFVPVGIIPCLAVSGRIGRINGKLLAIGFVLLIAKSWAAQYHFLLSRRIILITVVIDERWTLRDAASVRRLLTHIKSGILKCGTLKIEISILGCHLFLKYYYSRYWGIIICTSKYDCHIRVCYWGKLNVLDIHFPLTLWREYWIKSECHSIKFLIFKWLHYWDVLILK